MNNIYRALIILLVIGFTACTSNHSSMRATGGEDEDIGLGGTGLLATGDDSGLGGTGILGEITGFGSIFVNGIEIEYDNKTTFTVNGKKVAHQQLEVGDVVEVLTTDVNKHTQARIINLRHEVIGKVESVDPQTFSFIVHGQTIIQPINKRQLPVVGTSVAVSGFRVNNNTIVSTRVTPADAKQALLRTHTELPFKENTTHWRVQMHVQNHKAVFQLDGTAHTLSIKEKTKESLSDRLGIRIFQLQKPATGQLKLEQVIDPMDMPRGQLAPVPVQRYDGNGNKLQKRMMRSQSGAGSGTGGGLGKKKR